MLIPLWEGGKSAVLFYTTTYAKTIQRRGSEDQFIIHKPGLESQDLFPSFVTHEPDFSTVSQFSSLKQIREIIISSWGDGNSQLKDDYKIR